MKKSIKILFQLSFLVSALLFIPTSCEFSDSTEVLDQMSTGLDNPTIDEEDEKKQSPK